MTDQCQRISGQRIAGLVRKKLPGVRVWTHLVSFDRFLGIAFQRGRWRHGVIIKDFVRSDRELRLAADRVVSVLRKAHS